MKHFFILGNNPALSIAEILAIYPGETGKYLQPDVFLLEKDLSPRALIKNLGGTIKIGTLVTSIPKNNPQKIKEEILKLTTAKAKDKEGKFKFGISCHGKCGIHVKDVGIEIKKSLKEEGLSIRFVVSREKTLSSVVVTQNKLDSKGLEVILILDGQDVLIGYTEAVQDFKGLSYRDYSRPGRDDESGMIPPKLAQIMINLSGKVNENITFLDPFCGSGTVLMEASLMNIKKLIGSDISSKAIMDTKINIQWLIDKWKWEENNKLSMDNFQILQSSAVDISKKVKADSIDAIVTEPYLGPQKGMPDVGETTRELNTLYSEALKDFKKILKKDGVIVMIWPILMRNGKQYPLSPNIDGYEIINPLSGVNGISTTKQGTLIYGRQGQKVWREIVILNKK